MKIDFNSFTIKKTDSLLQVLKKMNQVNKKLLLVMENELFYGLVSIGDIQRAIIKNIDLNTEVFKILRSDITYATQEDNISEIKEKMKTRRNEIMPIVDADGKLVDIIQWEQLFDEKYTEKSKKFKGVSVVIMAGGQGTRLKPLTNVLPKPLIPLNDKTIIEEIIDRFINSGCIKFYISVNYKAEMIKYYLSTLNNSDYSVEYFQEEKPLGTCGSLSLLKGKIDNTVFISNCDILIDQNYSEILDFHIQNKNEITVVSALKHLSLPYGTVITGDHGNLIELIEKPEIIFKINTGMYIIEPSLINEIPENELYHMTFLITKIVKDGRKVGVFPISQNSWIDLGNWSDYIEHIKNPKK